MAYETHDFQSGETLYASQLNEMDAQIAQNEQTAAKAVKTVNGAAPDTNGNVAIEVSASDDNGIYELIETITLTEETAQVLRTAEPNGTPYNFKKLKIFSKVACASAQGGINFWAADNCLITGRSYLNPTNDAMYGTTYLEVDHGMFKGTGSFGHNSQYNTIGMDSAPYIRGSVFINAIEMLKLTTDNASILIPSGSTFTIYGVRA